MKVFCLRNFLLVMIACGTFGPETEGATRRACTGVLVGLATGRSVSSGKPPMADARNPKARWSYREFRRRALMTVQTRFTELLKEENRKDAKAPYRIKFRSGGFTHTNAEGFKGWKPTGMVEFSYEVWWNNRVHTRAEVVFDSQNGALISFGAWKGDGH